MDTINRRGYSRTSNIMPIVCTDLQTKKIYDATLVNHSKGGFFFESTHALSPGATVRLKKESDQTNYDETDFPTCFAEVIWCKKTEKSDAETGYNVGLQCVKYECMLCHAPLESSDLQDMESDRSMCPKCASSYDSICDGNIKKSIKNIMIGNIL